MGPLSSSSSRALVPYQALHGLKEWGVSLIETEELFLAIILKFTKLGGILAEMGRYGLIFTQDELSGFLNCCRSSENGSEISQFPASTPCYAPQGLGLMTKSTWQPIVGEFIIYLLLLFCVRASDSIKLNSSDYYSIHTTKYSISQDLVDTKVLVLNKRGHWSVLLVMIIMAGV
ncbi:hypothetical protein B9Z19DRAFT_175316 [Tuber borchii]|uniref:Uncharacterized protein n=1 Tax=Tuber borchii TaxID=42251 RepID=A0A2T6ZPI9_TUBBO|nr:hypothetical protein B9Z19DRAFT_175316 [Tuber borchii]